MDNLNTILKDRIISEINTDENTVVIHLKPKEKRLPKSWDELRKMFPVPFAFRLKCDPFDHMRITTQVDIPSVMADLTGDSELSDALIALIKLILLRDCYNGDWVPDWKDINQDKFTITIRSTELLTDMAWRDATPLYFKTEELRDEFLRNFRPLIKKLKPLYGIKEGDEE